MLKVISTAILAGVLLTVPVGALSLKLGDTPILDTGSKDDKPALKLDTGGDKPLLNLNPPGSTGDPLALNDPTDLFGGPATDEADDALADLFGPSASKQSAELDLGLSSLDPSGLLDLFGPDATTGGPNPGVIPGGGDTGGTGDRRLAALGDPAQGACFTPNAQQIDTLINRHRYDAKTIASWRGVNDLQIVEVGLCPDAALQLAEITAGNRNMIALQNYLAGQSTIRSQLGAQGHTINDVVAVDRNGKTLILYVI